MGNTRDTLRSSLFVRSIIYTLAGTLFLVSSAWNAAAAGQESATQAGSRTARALRSYGQDDMGGSGRFSAALDRAMRDAAHKLPRAPQDAGAQVTHHHDHRVLLDLTMGFLGVIGGSYTLSQSFSTTDKTPTADKVGGTVLIVTGVAAFIDLALHHPAKAPAGSAAATGASSAPVAYPAEAQEAQAQISRIASGPHAVAPPVQAVGNAGTGAPTLEIRNSTAYTLMIYLAGPLGRSLTIPPGGSETVELVAGRYQIGGRVSSPAVEPFLGTDDLDGGTSYVETFYIVTQPR